MCFAAQALGTDAWVKDATLLEKLKPFAEDAAFRKRWREIKQQKKASLAAHIKEVTGYEVSTEPMFDVQVGVQALGLGQSGTGMDIAGWDGWNAPGCAVDGGRPYAPSARNAQRWLLASACQQTGTCWNAAQATLLRGRRFCWEGAAFVAPTNLGVTARSLGTQHPRLLLSCCPAVKNAGQAHPRVQAPVHERHQHHLPLQGDQGDDPRAARQGAKGGRVGMACSSVLAE